MEPSVILEVGETLRTEAGIVAFTLFLVNIALGCIYFSERKDRREAWKAYNELAKETNAVLSKLTITLEVIKEKI